MYQAVQMETGSAQACAKDLKKWYACEKCEFITDEKRLLRRHKIKHRNILPYTCPVCDFKCKYYQQLKRHKLKLDHKA